MVQGKQGVVLMIPKGKSVYNGELCDTIEDCSLPDFCSVCEKDGPICSWNSDGCPYRELWKLMKEGFLNKKITLHDFEFRYQSIRMQYPKIERCSVDGCRNPIDVIPLMGRVSTCAYHRLLFDYWAYEVDAKLHDLDGWQHRLTNQRARRCAFTRWRNKFGQEECDRIVLELAKDGINWTC